MVLTHGEVAADDAPAASPVLRTLVLFEHVVFLLRVSVGFLRGLLTGAGVDRRVRLRGDRRQP